MIHLEKLCAGYDGRDVLFDASCTLPKGANLAVLGPNGCGKSTLLKAVAGILPSTGRIEIDGEDVRGMKRATLARKVALMGQTMAPGFAFTVEQTVLQGRYPHAKRSLLGAQHTAADLAAARHSMEVTGVADIAGREITTLSGGQLQRVFLARTLAQEPSVILLDEPTNHLDLKYQAELVDYLLEWSRNEEHTVVGVFHDLNLALKLADYALLLREGRQLAFGPTAQVMEQGLLQEAFEMDVSGYMKQALRRWEDL